MSLKGRTTTCVALLRGVNLGGHKMVPMAELRAMLADLGCTDPRTLLQSGNAVFGARTREVAGLDRRLEAALRDRLGIDVTCFIRTAAEWRRLIAANPFAAEARDDPGHLLVFALGQTPAPSGVAALRDAIRGRERMHADGAQLYVVYPDGVGRSKFTHGVIEKQLGTRGTGRNWNTVRKLAALVDG
jgi:uncharacterized protein (DUF1697 family)